MEIKTLLNHLNIPSEKRFKSIKTKEAEFMNHWVKDHEIKFTLETGLAFGVSACSIMSAHEGRHTCIDPYQEKGFQNTGLKNLASLGFSERVDFYEEFSDLVLPKLLMENKKYDFAFIDGNHLYDGIFLDFYYIDKLLLNKGYILFHDSWMRGTQLVASFIKKNRKDYQQIRCPIPNMILFQKIGIDQRKWDHFKEFYTWKNILLHQLVSRIPKKINNLLFYRT